MKGNGCALRSCILDMMCRYRKCAKGISTASRTVAKIDIEVGVVDVYPHDGGNAALMDTRFEGIEMVFWCCAGLRRPSGGLRHDDAGGASAKA